MFYIKSQCQTSTVGKGEKVQLEMNVGKTKGGFHLKVTGPVEEWEVRHILPYILINDHMQIIC